MSIAVGPRSNDPGDHCSTHLPFASTTHSADARSATPPAIGIVSAATRSVLRTVIAPRTTPNRSVPTRTPRGGHSRHAVRDGRGGRRSPCRPVRRSGPVVVDRAPEMRDAGLYRGDAVRIAPRPRFHDEADEAVPVG